MSIRGVRVVRGRNPFEMFILAACILTGASTLFGGADPPALQQALPGWMVTVWSCVLCGGGALALGGVLTRSPGLGMLVERIGLVVLFGPALSYAAAIVIANGTAGITSGVVTGSFAAAAIARAIQITRTVRIASREGGG